MARRSRGSGTVYRRRDGRWEVQFRLAGGGRKSLYAPSRREAARLAADLGWALELGLPVGAESRTVGQYLEHWLRVTEQRVRATTWGSYRRDIERLKPVLGGVPLGRLSPYLVQAAYQKMRLEGLSARSVERTHAVLRRALNQAVGWGLLRSNPALLAAPPRPPRRQMTALDAAQARRLLVSTDGDRWFRLWALLIGTGLRLGEALALTWSDVDLEAGNLAVRRTLQRNIGRGLVFAAPKTAQSRRSVPLPTFVITALQASTHRDPASLVFSNRRGGPQDPGSANAALTRCLRRAGLPHVRVHDLRHTTASVLLASSAHPKVVQELLGHRTVALTLDTYSHLLPPMTRTAATVIDAAVADGVSSAWA